MLLRSFSAKQNNPVAVFYPGVYVPGRRLTYSFIYLFIQHIYWCVIESILVTDKSPHSELYSHLIRYWGFYFIIIFFYEGKVIFKEPSISNFQTHPDIQVFTHIGVLEDFHVLQTATLRLFYLHEIANWFSILGQDGSNSHNMSYWMAVLWFKYKPS